MSNSAFPQSADLAGQSGFGVCRGKPRHLPDILMGKLASLIWLADVVCHWVSITCHSTLMPLDRADQTMSFDLRSTLKADRERDVERKRKGGGKRGRTLKAVNKMTLLFPLSYHVEKPIMVMLCMSVRIQQSLFLPFFQGS